MNAIEARDLLHLSGLKPESAESSKKTSWSACYLLWGGYLGPSWQVDRRPKPLRDRRSVQRYITGLRRSAVLNLRIQNLSYRDIARRLGISHVAVWKLWHQAFDDFCKRSNALKRGETRLLRSMVAAENGQLDLLDELKQEAIAHFGKRAKLPWS